MSSSQMLKRFVSSLLCSIQGMGPNTPRLDPILWCALLDIRVFNFLGVVHTKVFVKVSHHVFQDKDYPEPPRLIWKLHFKIWSILNPISSSAQAILCAIRNHTFMLTWFLKKASETSEACLVPHDESLIQTFGLGLVIQCHPALLLNHS